MIEIIHCFAFSTLIFTVHLSFSLLVLGFLPWGKMFLLSAMVGMLLGRRSCWRSKRKERSEWSALGLSIYPKKHFMNCSRFHRQEWLENHTSIPLMLSIQMICFFWDFRRKSFGKAFDVVGMLWWDRSYWNSRDSALALMSCPRFVLREKRMKTLHVVIDDSLVISSWIFFHFFFSLLNENQQR